MNEQRIREIAEQSSCHAENSADYYSGVIDGLTWEAKILKVRDLKFTELIVKECMTISDDLKAHYFTMRKNTPKFDEKNIYAEGEAACDILQHKIKNHFGVE